MVYGIQESENCQLTDIQTIQIIISFSWLNKITNLKSKTRMIAGVLKQDPNTQNINLFNPELCSKRYWRGPKSHEVGEEGDYACWAVQAVLLTPFTFTRRRLSPFTYGAYLFLNGRR